MDNCIFCKIARGEIPSLQVYEDEQVIAFLDINPSSEGHTLIVPREHAPDLFSLRPETLAAVARATQAVAGRIRAALQPAGLNVLQNNGPASGQVIFHYHVHLIPRREGDGVLRVRHEPADQQQLQQIAERIRQAGGA